MDSEVKKLEKTIKQAKKLAAEITADKSAKTTSRRIKRIAVLVAGGFMLLMLLLPPFIFPVEGTVTSGFFLRKRPESMFILNLETHKGLDLAAPTGTRVYSSAPGIVTAAGWSDSFGNYVEVTHFLGVRTYYAHLSEISARRGRLVIIRNLRPIGRVGSTGRSTGPHLHFEVKVLGTSLPPRFFLVFHGIRKALLRF
jgi:murein DD-endopeptidase MepM/ murein hydrolase activator NlpD